MTIYNYQQLVSFAQSAGFTGLSANIIAAISEAESGGNTAASHVNADGSIDRGILQFNSYWHSEVSNTCASDPQCSFQAAYRVSNSGSNFNEWDTYLDGSYKEYITGTALAQETATNLAATSIDPLSPLESIVSTVTGSGLWEWLTSPIRFIKFVAGLGLLTGALLLFIAPHAIDAIDKSGVLKQHA